MSAIKNIKNSVAKELSATLSIIDQALLSGKRSALNETINYILKSEGKYLRPALTLFVYSALYAQNNDAINAEIHDQNDDPKPILYLAAAVEVLHTATLLHDDVVDGSKLRRNKIVANLLWGNKQAILVGDFLFSQAFKFLVKTGSMPVLDLVSMVSANIAAAEVKQLNFLLEVSEIRKEKIDMEKANYDSYMDIIQGKTAELFAATCKSAAMLAGHNADADIWWDFGLNFGLIFQIIDDINDYTLDVSNSGKDSMLDIKDGKITLPTILLWQLSTPEEKEFISELLEINIKKYLKAEKNHPDYDEVEYEYSAYARIAKMINKYDVIKIARLYAVEYAHIAISRLRKIQEKYNNIQFNQDLEKLALLITELIGIKYFE